MFTAHSVLSGLTHPAARCALNQHSPQSFTTGRSQRCHKTIGKHGLQRTHNVQPSLWSIVVEPSRSIVQNLHIWGWSRERQGGGGERAKRRQRDKRSRQPAKHKTFIIWPFTENLLHSALMPDFKNFTYFLIHYISETNQSSIPGVSGAAFPICPRNHPSAHNPPPATLQISTTFLP